MPEDRWRHFIEDFAASFGINRHLLLESLIFYLLDDLNDEAMQVSYDFSTFLSECIF